jgi:hypothetical protein
MIAIICLGISVLRVMITSPHFLSMVGKPAKSQIIFELSLLFDLLVTGIQQKGRVTITLPLKTSGWNLFALP